jgi:hypothetical protein
VTPLASIALSRRLTQVNIAYTITRMRVIEARSGQPIGVRRFGEAAALMSRQVPSPHFNAVVGLRAGQESLIGEIDDWYRENKITPRFLVAQGDLTAGMGRALARICRHRHRHGALWSRARPGPAGNPHRYRAGRFT